MELTVELAKKYLDSIGISLPDFLIEILVEQANSIDACLIGAGYPAATALLIKLYLFALLSMGNADRQITSQTAPSGASRSFKYGSLSDRWKGVLGMLANLDKSGCATGLIPADPTQANFGGIWVVNGGCVDGGCS